MNLAEINFPVYRLSKQPKSHEGILYFLTESYDPDTNTFSQSIRILDDKSIEAETLSRRRLILKEDGAPLYPLRKAIFMLGDFIRLNKPSCWWIDSSGKLFSYRKSERVKLRFYKIKNIMPAKGTGAIIEVHGIPQRFKTIFNPDKTHTHAGILEIGRMKVLYCTSDGYIKDSWRKV